MIRVGDRVQFRSLPLTTPERIATGEVIAITPGANPGEWYKIRQDDGIARDVRLEEIVKVMK